MVFDSLGPWLLLEGRWRGRQREERDSSVDAPVLTRYSGKIVGLAASCTVNCTLSNSFERL